MEKENKITHFLMVPFTGLGCYGGFRGNRWLKNRIKIFEQFVIPSILAQTSKNFIVWIAWRHEEKFNSLVKEFKERLSEIKELKFVHTHAGIPFWDDKYPDDIARSRLAEAIHGSLADLFEPIGVTDYVYMTIQPSDDCYHKEMVEQIQSAFDKMPEIQVLGFKRGYIMNYQTKEVAEYNPNTIPPFFTIKFPTPIFIEPFKHIDYTGPYKSHEYVGDKLKLGLIEQRGFIVGCHGENISTHFNHPFKGTTLESWLRDKVLEDFGLEKVEPLKLKISLRKMLMRKLPYGWQRKLRYLFGEKFFAKIYEFLRA